MASHQTKLKCNKLNVRNSIQTDPIYGYDHIIITIDLQENICNSYLEIITKRPQ